MVGCSGELALRKNPQLLKVEGCIDFGTFTHLGGVPGPPFLGVEPFRSVASIGLEL